jgi:molybdenum cofactor synthesis domain-containing protein
MISSFASFKAAVLIVSDRSFAGQRPDTTGPVLENRLKQMGFSIVVRELVPDEKLAIISAFQRWISADCFQLILVSGGTGLGPRDVTPEATLEVIERRVPGMEEAMRHSSMKATPHAMLSRGVVGIAQKSLIVNLPGKTQGALDNLNVIESALEHALLLISGEKADP